MNKQALKKNRIRKGDVVVVIAGRDRGKSGKCCQLIRSGEGCGRKVEHDQASHQAESESQTRWHSRTGSAICDFKCDVFVPCDAEADSVGCAGA
jgi:Ribosomal protein L24